MCILIRGMHGIIISSHKRSEEQIYIVCYKLNLTPTSLHIKLIIPPSKCHHWISFSVLKQYREIYSRQHLNNKVFNWLISYFCKEGWLCEHVNGDRMVSLSLPICRTVHPPCPSSPLIPDCEEVQSCDYYTQGFSIVTSL